MVEAMRSGSVIVDLAAEQQGNCALTRPGATVVEHGVTIIGETDLASRMSAHASQMYSRNMEKLLFYVTKDGAFNLDFKDEIVAGSVITHGGEIVHAKVKELTEPKARASESAGAS
jgi:NAD(P) transhydrogenase subunit alpha